ncbi:tol-pal system protein YbgF [Devosia crocina]|uniref:Cell division coordinator CpoB n=1 Tax=Devosia crocina TaxID=429728 RepID=A0A1I7MXJ1_9HYPH|nr:tol-pal system protein YbgF [Devosia crocina]SFV27104.1 tol-pal system protein YbgF [Devosia crocina]
MKLGLINTKARAGLCALAMGLGLYAPATQAQTLPAELSGLAFTNTQPDRMLVAQADSAQLMVRIQQLEEQTRSLNGQIEGLTFQLTQMQEIVNRMQEDNEFRFQQLEGGAGGKTEAVTQPGGVTPPEASPQNQSPVPTGEDAVPMTDIPEQGVQPLPGEIEFDPTFDDQSAAPTDEIGNSADPLVGTGQAGGIDLVTGQPLDLSYNPSSRDTGNADADAQFAAGYEAMVAGDYAFASDQFSQFVELYPNNPQITDAANWLGEALIYESQFDRAAEVLLDAWQKEPEHARAPDLLLKLGMALNGAGERETACRTFGEVERRYTAVPPAFTTRLGEEKAKAQCPPA